MKARIKCGGKFDTGDFYPGKNTCKKCHNRLGQQNYRRNKDRYQAKNREWWLSSKYKITPEAYQIILDKQGKRCAICRSDYPGKRTKYFPVDHDHATGEVRGLLCHSCNVALGGFRDNIEIMRQAISYLSKHARAERKP